MARKPIVPAIVARQWRSAEEIDQGIARLRRRIAQVEQYDVFRAEPGAEAVLVSNFNETISEVFGPDSPELRDHKTHNLWSGPMFIGMTDAAVKEAKERGRQALLTKLHGLIGRLEEKRADFGAISSLNSDATFAQLNLHGRIGEAAEDLFVGGHYAEAVFAGAKSLLNYVKEKSGKDAEGTGLMQSVFSRNAPVLRVNELATDSDRDEQEGVMHLMTGAVKALRNPGGHAFPELTIQQATDRLILLSMLAKYVQTAKK
jgi:uncharacterized protein (TIGR02391 family)